MKNKTEIIALILVMLSFAVNIHAGQPLRGESYTEFGDYSIKVSDTPLVIDGVSIPTYEIEYSNLNDVVKIGIDEQKRCKNFIVKHPGFEIQYVCNKNGFGVRFMEEEYASLQPGIINAIMDNNQYNYQRVIVPAEKPTEDLLHLIACYFPQLISKDIRKAMNT
jgi:hypothetical protein